MTLTQMQYFEAVCRHMSLTRAAKELHISQPALSMAMRDIESQCNAELFHRSANSLSITDQGAVLYQEVKNLLDRYSNLEYMISHNMLGRNFVRIGYGALSASTFMPEIVSRFRKRHPNILLFFYEGPAATNVELLKNGKVDLIIANGRQLVLQGNKADIENYAIVPLDDLRMMFAVSVDNPLAQRQKAEWTDIIQEPLILLGPPFKMGDHIREYMNTDGYDLPGNVYFTSQIHTLIRFVEENAAASFLPSTGVRNNPRIKLVDYPASYSTALTLVYRKDSRQVEAVRQFLEMI